MLPPRPSVPDDQRGSGSYPLRFEDLSQDRRLLLETVVASVGPALWKAVLSRHAAAAAMNADGVRPIFTRLLVDGGAARFHFPADLTASGAYELASERAADGTIVRLYLNMWTEIEPMPDDRASPPRLFAEHVLTRPVAPPERRRVTQVPGIEPPRTEYRQPPVQQTLALPEGATWLETSLRADVRPNAFGLVHTDINQHVNSLVYPRLFEEAALRRFAELGRDTRVLSRRLEITFKRPFFAGQTARIALRAFAAGERLGAVGVFVEGNESADATFEGVRANAYVRMWFER